MPPYCDYTIFIAAFANIYFMYSYFYSRVRKYYSFYDRSAAYEKKIHQIYSSPVEETAPVVLYNFPKLHLGCSETEVLHTMGKPRFKKNLKVSSGVRVLFYKYIIGGQKCVIQLHFKSGCLIYVNYTFRAIITDANFFRNIIYNTNNTALTELINSTDFSFAKDNFIGLNNEHCLCIEHNVVTEITLMDKDILNRKLNDQFFNVRVKKFVGQNASSSFAQMFLLMPEFA